MAKRFITIIAFAIAGFAPGIAAADPLPSLETSSGWYKHLVQVTSKISAKPKAYKKDRPNGYKWATNNLKKDLTNVKSVIWKRHSERLTINTNFEKDTYNRLTYNEAIRHALSMAALDPLVKQSDSLVKKITSLQAFKCKAKLNRKAKNKKRARKLYRKKIKRCKNNRAKNLKKSRANLRKVNAKLEPARQAKLADHNAKVEAINSGMATLRVALRNTSNSSTIMELQEVTKLANKGRVLIGLKPLRLPEPKMASVYSAQNEFWSMMSADDIDYNRAAQAGIGSIRGLVWIPGIMQSKNYSWSGQDAHFRKRAQAGIRTIPVICGESPNKKRFAGPFDSNWKEYKAAVFATVKRYGPGGDFWKENKSLPYVPITTWEVCNEPNLRHFVPGGRINTTSVASYRQYLVQVSRIIRKANRQAVVLVGGLASIKGAKRPNGIPGVRFLSDLYRYPEVRASFDGVAYHPYANSPEEVIDEVRAVRNVMDKNGDNGKTIHITEVGWGTDGGDRALSVSPQQQAENLTKSLSWFKENKNQYKIGTVAWYFWQDIKRPAMGGTTRMNWDSYAGLFDVNGNPKPAWYAFLNVTGGS